MKKSLQSRKPMRWREAIEFLLRFAQMENLEDLRPGDRLNLIDDLKRYLEDDGEGKLGKELAEVAAKPLLLKGLIQEVRTLVGCAVEGLSRDFNLGGTTLTFDGSRLGDERRVLTFDGSLNDALVDDAAFDLSDAKPWEMCRCKEQDCQKLFLAARKGQIYCSHACASTASVREHRSRKAKGTSKPRKSRTQNVRS